MNALSFCDQRIENGNRYVNIQKTFPTANKYCKCVYPRITEMTSMKGIVHDQIVCRCGENQGHPIIWNWDKESVHPAECLIVGPKVTFHPVYSQGTSMIRGNTRLEPGMIHYWEIKIITCLAGTDVLFGIGTDKVDLQAFKHHFTSALGLDAYSWGFSFRGFAQHNGIFKYYGKKFSQACIVGVYLDLFAGHLEYYLNRRPLGTAYRNIPTDNQVQIYPMVSATAAKSAIKLINATSCEHSLQFQCMRVISKRPKLLAELHRMPGLKSLVRQFWFLSTKEQMEYSSESSAERMSQNLPLEDEAVLMSSKSKKLRFDEDDDIDDVDDVYKNVDKITHAPYICKQTMSSSDSEDEFNLPNSIMSFYCNH